MSKAPQTAERGSFSMSAFRRDSVCVFFQKVDGSGGHLPDQEIDTPLAISSTATLRMAVNRSCYRIDALSTLCLLVMFQCGPCFWQVLVTRACRDLVHTTFPQRAPRRLVDAAIRVITSTVRNPSGRNVSQETEHTRRLSALERALRVTTRLFGPKCSFPR